MDNICKICNLEVSEKSHFWKTHKIKIEDYYKKYFPKADLLTGEQIPFKSPEQYLSSDFTDKNNLKKYLESVTKEKGLSYLCEWLKKRAKDKNLVYSPSQFELRTLCYPSIKFFHKFYGEHAYGTICHFAELKDRYDYKQKLEYDDSIPEILIDTREQTVLNLKCPKEIIKLNFADYSCKENKFNVFVERKSVQDFLGSVSSGFDRLCREMQRAKDSNAHIIILIESKISNLFGFEHLGFIHSEASADFILKRARDLLVKFDNVQICCVDGRAKASEFIVNLYKMKNDPRAVDFQFCVDSKLI